MVRRNFKRLDKNDFLVIYKTYIRPHLEYCIQAWSPHLTKDIQCLERVQKSATNLIPALKKYSYTDRLKKLGLTTLQTRSVRGDMIQVYMTGKDKGAVLSTGRQQLWTTRPQPKNTKRPTKFRHRETFL